MQHHSPLDRQRFNRAELAGPSYFRIGYIVTSADNPRVGMPFPIQLNPYVAAPAAAQQRAVTLHEGITVLIGANGSGKTQLLRGMKQALASHAGGKHVRYLSAGRAWSLEQFRSDYDGHRGNNPSYESAQYGSLNDSKRRLNYETLQGDFHTLLARPDIFIKVRERLRKLFARDVSIYWNDGQLKIDFLRTTGIGARYSSAREASGLLHLAGLLSAAYDDDVGALLIDEPEVSLHPQLQAFLLKELRAVAGEPTSGNNKKLIILATHSTEFIGLDSPEQLPSLIFCYDSEQQPIQVDPNAGELKSKKVINLIARMGQEHKLCFFARSPLLIEGPSDSIICNALSNRLGISLEAGGAQILPVIGKGQFPVVNKLFRMLGKTPLILADADALADGVELANEFLKGEAVDRLVAQMGAKSGPELSRSILHDFCDLVDKRWTEIKATAETHWYWVNREKSDAESKAQRRAALSSLFSLDDSAADELAGDNAWLRIKHRLGALMDLLESQGLFILRRGTIESYYTFISAGATEKPSMAAEEAAQLRSGDIARIEEMYGDVLRFLRAAAATQSISEVETLQDMFLAVVAPALARVKSGTTTELLQGLLKGTIGPQADIFDLEVTADKKLKISLRSNILDVSGFPITLSPDDDLLKTVRTALGLKG